MTDVVGENVELDGTAQSAGTNRSSSANASFMLYTISDGVLIFLQRMLLSVMVLCGYDIHASHEHGQLGLLQHFIRFVRNLYHISKALRKWLSLNYNDGVIPNPPVTKQTSLNMQYRSTPKHADQSNGLDKLLKAHSPIAKCYSEPPKRYSLIHAFKNKHSTHDDSDFLLHSMSFSSVMNSFLHSFTGYVEDPENEEEGNKPLVAPADKMEHADAEHYVTTDEGEAEQKVHSKLITSVVEEKSNEVDESSSESESASESDDEKSESSSDEDEVNDESDKENEAAKALMEAKQIAESPEFDLSEEARAQWRKHPIQVPNFDTTDEAASPARADD